MKFSVRLQPGPKLAVKGPEFVRAFDVLLAHIAENHGKLPLEEIAGIRAQSVDVSAMVSNFIATAAELAFLENRDAFLREATPADTRLQDANEDLAESYKRLAQARAVLALLLSGSCVLTFGEGSPSAPQ